MQAVIVVAVFAVIVAGLIWAVIDEPPWPIKRHDR